MKNTLKIRVSCPSCEEPVKFIYPNYDELSISQISNILDAEKYKDDYHISVMECEHPNRECNRDATHVHALSNLILWVSRVRLTRRVYCLVEKEEKFWVDTIAATKGYMPFVCDAVEWNGYKLTFINSIFGDNTEGMLLKNLLEDQGYSCGISKYGNPYVKGHYIKVVHEERPLFKYGVWVVYDYRIVTDWEYTKKTDE